ncbi:MAG: N-acetylmuramoyl-L-alanine amidase, partial [Raoultibacter sp.]
CPVLLTNANGLSSETANALSTLGVSFVIIVGGEPSVGSQVVADLDGMSIATKRLSGFSRYDTQIAIYQYGIDGDAEHGIPAGLWNGNMVAVASGSNFADALSFSPVAYSAKIPVFLTNEYGLFSAAQEESLIKSAKTYGLGKQAIAMGDEIRITESTLGFLSGISYLATKGGEAFVPERLSGETRYETSSMIAQWAVDRNYLSWDKAAFTAGEKPYDALGGGSLQGKQKSVMLLVRDSGSNPGIDLAAQQQLSSIKLFGDKSSVSNALRMEMADRFGFAYSDIVGLKIYIDAGHGWDSSNNDAMDYGASGCGYTEWELTLDLASRVGNELRSQYGIETYVNDDGGWYKLRQAEAQALGCDLLVSIHFNAFNGVASGVESYIHSYNAHPLSSSLQAKVHPSLVNAVGLSNRGQKEAELAVCGGKLPAVLLEVCFIDNQGDIDTYIPRRDRVAAGIAAGIAS